jgi:uncharacterized membrane protein YadS
MSVHEVAQVVAAAGTVSAAALTVAVVAKLARVVLLAPLVAGTGVVRRRRADRADAAAAGQAPARRGGPLVPLFVVGFLVAVLVRSAGLVPEAVLPAVKPVTTLALGAAMVALGTQIRVGRLVRTGGRPVLLGGVATVVAAGTSLVGLVLVT